MTGHAAECMKNLPSAQECSRIFRAAAMLDAMLSPEWDYRYYSYNAKWYEEEEMASLRDGEGSHYFAQFAQDRLTIKGFDRERAELGSSAIGVDAVPAEVSEFLREPAFMGDETTFCLWNLPESPGWSADKLYTEQDCRLLRVLTGEAAYYCQWAAEYYETELDPRAVARIFALEPLTSELLGLFTDELSLAELEEDLEEIGYPIGGKGEANSK
ncbi:hypothetical protein QWJ34_22270 [Saccharibacillus sp. CPCC 101409]|uniref:hypothetical protein n=1 Tax=Saccharibacillus sp. CPCC 101409 TaxID=3058041 RepID=UPI002670FA3E|nr:hypothetical protein [Saccharibacillus sp. CPCC 101409]MDO3412507.1 hypothetical protein [Saccharibacillus sp. CPCC 101409]